MSCSSRIDRALEAAVMLPLNRHSRYAVFSDCHRGIGNANDNFLKNEHLYMAALGDYFRRQFFYIELGDGEELWENTCIQRIRDCHSHVYELQAAFAEQKRFVKIYGNHDMELRCSLPEAVILENQEGGRNIYMMHGHQADFFNYSGWRLARFLVRYLWRPLELLGVNDPTSAARNYRKTHRYENCIKAWSIENNAYLVAGHSHRPRLPEEGEGYMNAGCMIHPGGITCIEIENMQATLVKWVTRTRSDMVLYVNREIIQGPMRIR